MASENPFGRVECSNCFLFFFCFSLLCFTFPPLELLQVPGRKCTLCFLFLDKGSIGIFLGVGLAVVEGQPFGIKKVGLGCLGVQLVNWLKCFTR